MSTPEKNREHYWRLVSMGVCTKCGQRMAIKGERLCPICKNRSNENRRIRNYKPVKMNDRWHIGLCRFCENPVEPGYKVCKYHHELSRISARKPRKKRWVDG